MTGPADDEARQTDKGSNASSPGSIGPYRLLQKIGEGGMGEIWLAEQHYPVHRKVAIKVLKAGRDTAQVVARFEAERQALAIMDHPTIAKVFDGGATAAGLPYFAMEYVRGEQITAYCDSHSLSIRDRLELFAELCEGVQHAHQKGVIHRDLKPSNVLVALRGDQVVPRIIDFGIAKAIGQPLTERTVHTQLGGFLGTPEYMSPEQAELTGLDVDTRSDIYSLGILLFELLTGTLPFDPRRFREAGFDDVRRTIREEHAPRPSTRIARLGPSAVQAAENRRTQVPKLVRQLRGDLDWIVLRALEKDRTRRYQTASAIASDIRRHLSDEPVSAGPPSSMYRIGKFAKRYRVGVSAVAALALLVLAFGVTMGVQARRIAREAARANEAEATALAEAATGKAVLEFLRNDLLALAGPTAQAAPEVNPNLDLTVRTALDRAAQSVTGRFVDQPLVEAAIRHTIGSTYQDLGLYQEAERELALALDLRRSGLGERDPETLSTASLLGDTYRLRGKYKEAEQLLSGVVDIQARDLGEDDPETLTSMNNLAIIYRNAGEYAQAEQLYQRALAAKRSGNSDTVSILSTEINLGLLYTYQRNYAAAEAMLGNAVDTSRRVLGEEHPATITAVNNLALAYEGAGKFAEAERRHREVLAVALRAWGEQHPNTLKSMGNLATALRLQGKYAEAGTLLSSALEVGLRVHGERNPGTLETRHCLAELYRDEGKNAEARRLADSVLEARREVLGPAHPETIAAMATLADVHRREGNYGRAEELFGAVAESLRRAVGEQHPDTLEAMAQVGDIRVEQRRFSDAEAVLRGVVDQFERATIDTWVRFNSTSLLGASLAGQRRYAEAEPKLLAGYEGVVRLRDTVPASIREVTVDSSMQRILELYVGWNRPEEAAAWRTRAEATRQSER